MEDEIEALENIPAEGKTLKSEGRPFFKAFKKAKITPSSEQSSVTSPSSSTSHKRMLLPKPSPKILHLSNSSPKLTKIYYKNHQVKLTRCDPSASNNNEHLLPCNNNVVQFRKLSASSQPTHTDGIYRNSKQSVIGCLVNVKSVVSSANSLSDSVKTSIASSVHELVPSVVVPAVRNYITSKVTPPVSSFVPTAVANSVGTLVPLIPPPILSSVAPTNASNNSIVTHVSTSDPFIVTSSATDSGTFLNLKSSPDKTHFTVNNHNFTDSFRPIKPKQISLSPNTVEDPPLSTPVIQTVFSASLPQKVEDKNVMEYTLVQTPDGSGYRVVYVPKRVNASTNNTSNLNNIKEKITMVKAPNNTGRILNKEDIANASSNKSAQIFSGDNFEIKLKGNFEDGSKNEAGIVRVVKRGRPRKKTTENHLEMGARRREFNKSSGELLTQEMSGMNPSNVRRNEVESDTSMKSMEQGTQTDVHCWLFKNGSMLSFASCKGNFDNRLMVNKIEVKRAFVMDSLQDRGIQTDLPSPEDRGIQTDLPSPEDRGIQTDLPSPEDRGIQTDLPSPETKETMEKDRCHLSNINLTVSLQMSEMNDLGEETQTSMPKEIVDSLPQSEPIIGKSLNKNRSCISINNLPRGLLMNLYNDIKTCLKEDEFGNIPLHQAVLDNDFKRVKCNCLIMKGLNLKENINYTNEDSETALMLAVKRAVVTGWTDLVKYLIGESADQTIPDDNGCLPLHYAVRHGNLEIVKILLSGQNYASIINKTYQGFAPLHFAAMGGHTEIVELLLDRVADVNIKDRKNGRTPFYLAVENKHMTTSKILTSRGANITETNFAGHVAPGIFLESGDSKQGTKCKYDFYKNSSESYQIKDDRDHIDKNSSVSVQGMKSLYQTYEDNSDEVKEAVAVLLKGNSQSSNDFVLSKIHSHSKSEDTLPKVDSHNKCDRTITVGNSQPNYQTASNNFDLPNENGHCNLETTSQVANNLNVFNECQKDVLKQNASSESHPYYYKTVEGNVVRLNGVSLLQSESIPKQSQQVCVTDVTGSERDSVSNPENDSDSLQSKVPKLVYDSNSKSKSFPNKNVVFIDIEKLLKKGSDSRNGTHTDCVKSTSPSVDKNQKEIVELLEDEYDDIRSDNEVDSFSHLEVQDEIEVTCDKVSGDRNNFETDSFELEKVSQGECSQSVIELTSDEDSIHSVQEDYEKVEVDEDQSNLVNMGDNVWIFQRDSNPEKDQRPLSRTLKRNRDNLFLGQDESLCSREKKNKS